jgi:uncharacterized protein (TIGR02453 family)
MEFQGFSPETVDFLWGLRFNNNREWFEPHKEQYKRSLYEPMKALAAAVYPPVREAFPALDCKVSRIYRDARLHPPTPYKESLWFCLRTADRPWGEQPVLFFELTPEDYSFGFLFWFARTWQMEQLRQQLAAGPEPFLKIVEGMEASGLPLCSGTYRRPKPCDDPRLTRFFAMKNLAAFVNRSTDERLFSPELATEISECFEKCFPLMDYCRRVML